MTDNPDYEVVARGDAAYAGVIREIANERVRQISEEGFTPEHDDAHDDESLAIAAACYAAPLCVAWIDDTGPPILMWPWDPKWWKPENGPGCSRRDLVKAAALLVAEIERRDRAAAKDQA